VGDPFDVFAPGSVSHPLRPVFRRWFAWQLKKQCRQAVGVAYVTERTLQNRYPASAGAYTTSYSSVDLPESAFGTRLQKPRPHGRSLTLLTIGSMAQPYKGTDVLIDAFHLASQRYEDLELLIVGDGKHRAAFEQHARRLGLGQRVRFLGEVPAGESVLQLLDRADLFVLPSRTEGLPRAMVEAMARGLPCLGTAVGGIPELLSDEDLVPPNAPTALARKLHEVISSPARMAAMSRRNQQKAGEFHSELLGKRRLEFYRYVKHRTEEWIKR
jgi:glycosyltransferase involved in cell wall biosynthesis